MKAFIKNDEVAWEIPSHIGKRFIAGVYNPPPGDWQVVEGIPAKTKSKQDDFGIWRPLFLMSQEVK